MIFVYIVVSENRDTTVNLYLLAAKEFFYALLQILLIHKYELSFLLLTSAVILKSLNIYVSNLKTNFVASFEVITVEGD